MVSSSMRAGSATKTRVCRRQVLIVAGVLVFVAAWMETRKLGILTRPREVKSYPIVIIMLQGSNPQLTCTQSLLSRHCSCS